MTKFSTNQHFIFQRFECYTTLIVQELPYNKKSQIIYFYFIKCRTYITITVTNISSNIMKQYYDIIKLFKVLVIIKKKQFSRTNIRI